MEDEKKLYLFEEAPMSKAVVSMCVPTIISSLVMVIYNLARSEERRVGKECML